METTNSEVALRDVYSVYATFYPESREWVGIAEYHRDTGRRGKVVVAGERLERLFAPVFSLEEVYSLPTGEWFRDPTDHAMVQNSVVRAVVNRRGGNISIYVRRKPSITLEPIPLPEHKALRKKVIDIISLRHHIMPHKHGWWVVFSGHSGSGKTAALTELLLAIIEASPAYRLSNEVVRDVPPMVIGESVPEIAGIIAAAVGRIPPQMAIYSGSPTKARWMQRDDGKVLEAFEAAAKTVAPELVVWQEATATHKPLRVAAAANTPFAGTLFLPRDKGVELGEEGEGTKIEVWRMRGGQVEGIEWYIGDRRVAYFDGRLPDLAVNTAIAEDEYFDAVRGLADVQVKRV